MKVLNTTGNPILSVFNRRLKAGASLHPTADALFRSMANFLLPLVAAVGKPSIQFFGSQPFEYEGRHFGIDATWVFPDGAIDGVHASFMVEENGRGFQFVLFDQRHGTITELWHGFSRNLATDMRACVQGMINYCSSRP